MVSTNLKYVHVKKVFFQLFETTSYSGFMILYVPSQHLILSHSLDNSKNLF